MGGRGASSGGKWKVSEGMKAKVGDRVVVKDNETGSFRERRGYLSFWQQMLHDNVSKFGNGGWQPDESQYSESLEVVKESEKALKVKVNVNNWKTDKDDTWEVWMPRKAFN